MTPLLLSTLLLLPFPSVRSELVAQERLVILDREASEALLLDPSTREVVARLPVGVSPHEVAISRDGRFAYVVNAGGGSAPVGSADGAEPAEGPEQAAARRAQGAGAAAGAEAGGLGMPTPPPRRGTVTVLDLREQSVAGTYYPGGYADFGGIGVSGNGRRLWFTAQADSGVVELDTRTGAVLMFWKTGGARGRSIVVGPASRKLYVANSGSDSVTRIDRLTVAVKRIPTGRGPDGLALSPRARELWVANREDHSITVIDTRTERVLATLDAGGRGPSRIAFRPDGAEVWVANRESGSLSVFETGCRHLTGTIPLDVDPAALVFSPDGKRAFVSAPERGRLLVIDVMAREVVADLGPGLTPEAMAWRVGVAEAEAPSEGEVGPGGR